MPRFDPQKEFRLRVMAEYGSSGIWGIRQAGPFRHGMIGHKALKLPANLAQGFEAWIEWYYDRLGYDGVVFDTEKFNAEGLRLARELKAFLGADVYVEYISELENGGLGEALEIRLDTW